jgi:hypothetical protein
MVKKLMELANDTVIKRERDYRESLKKIPPSGDVELFD